MNKTAYNSKFSIASDVAALIIKKERESGNGSKPAHFSRLTGVDVNSLNWKVYGLKSIESGEGDANYNQQLVHVYNMYNDLPLRVLYFVLGTMIR